MEYEIIIIVLMTCHGHEISRPLCGISVLNCHGRKLLYIEEASLIYQLIIDNIVEASLMYQITIDRETQRYSAGPYPGRVMGGYTQPPFETNNIHK